MTVSLPAVPAHRTVLVLYFASFTWLFSEDCVRTVRTIAAMSALATQWVFGNSSVIELFSRPLLLDAHWGMLCLENPVNRTSFVDPVVENYDLERLTNLALV